MRWISRWFRSPTAPRVAITVLPIGQRHGTDNHLPLEQALAVLEERGLTATWGVASCVRDFRLAGSLVASRCPHELAFVLGRADIASEVATFGEFSRVARRVALPLRCLIATGAGVHPSLLSQWEVEAVVPVGLSVEPSRTGSLRALTWGVWEAPVTDRLATPISATEFAGLESRLQLAVSQSMRMHLLWQVGPHSLRPDWRYVCKLLDQVAEFHQRGWLKVETAGSAAEQLSRQATPRVAG
ncbi:hypothetical protein [Aeoliella sp.]|uniref:hypothetical protein n=1 Tax=Aeoliella sp. TaxID=2795800 RepID=UPI003CCB8503